MITGEAAVNTKEVSKDVQIRSCFRRTLCDNCLSVALTLFFVPVRFRTLSESETAVADFRSPKRPFQWPENDRFGCRNDRFPATETSVFVLSYPQEVR